MDEKTLKALEASISHWEENCNAQCIEEVKLGYKYCSLCEMFLTNNLNKACNGCPVKEKTKRCGCYRSPYFKVFSAKNHYRIGEPIIEITALCKEELNFLCSLLPPSHEKYKPEE